MYELSRGRYVGWPLALMYVRLREAAKTWSTIRTFTMTRRTQSCVVGNVPLSTAEVNLLPLADGAHGVTGPLVWPIRPAHTVMARNNGGESVTDKR